MSEEERRRKIIIDSQIVAAANAGISAAMSDGLTREECQQWIALDEEYLGKLKAFLSQETLAKMNLA